MFLCLVRGKVEFGDAGWVVRGDDGFIFYGLETPVIVYTY